MDDVNPALRTESDSLGQIAVPADAYWGAQTQRSIMHFAFAHRERMPIEIVRALAMIKAAAARLNHAQLPSGVPEAIGEAAAEIMAGEHADQFPLAIWQTGSGTQTNMNVNEVIAGRANELLTGQRGGKSPVHPNDHVNLHQSSNDSFPTALHIAVTLSATDRLVPTLDAMTSQIDGLADQWRGIIKIGRTHLQDATPLTLGQEFSAFAAQLRQCRAELDAAIDSLFEIARVRRRWEPALMLRLALPKRWPRRSLKSAVCHFARPGTLLPRFLARNPWCDFRGALQPSPAPSANWPTTFGFWPADRAAASENCSYPPTSQAARSCPAKSTRRSARC